MGLVAQKVLEVVKFMFFGDAVLLWPHVIEKKVFKFMEFVVGASEVRDLCVEYPSVCCVTLEDVRQVVKRCDDVVHGKVVGQFGFVSSSSRRRGHLCLFGCLAIRFSVPCNNSERAVEGPVTTSNLSLRGLESPWTGAEVSSLRRDASLWSSSIRSKSSSNGLVKGSVAALI